MFSKIFTSSLLFLVAIGGFFVSVRLDESVTDKNTISSVSIELPQTYANNVGTYNQPGAIPGQSGIASTTSSSTQGTDKKGEDLLNSWVTLWNTILQIITSIIPVFVSFTSWLMSPDWTSGDLFRIRTPLYSMWVTIANIVYFVYAILLILIALATILGKENFNYKAMLPRLALGLLMVPFTWWFVQWTISLSAIVTASTISIPTDILTRTEGGAWWRSKTIPNVYTIEDGNLFKTGAQIKCPGSAQCSSPEEFIEAGGGMYGPLIIYAYGVFSVDKVKEMNTGVDVAKNITQVLNQMIMGGIMFLVFGILVVALTVMLLYRAIMLWMYMVFSPLFTLHFVAGKDLLGGKLESFDMQQFIGLCFMPAVVGLVLSFGLVIVSTVQSTGSNNPSVQPCTPTLLTGQGCEIDSVVKVNRKLVPDGDKYRTVNEVKIGTMTIVFKGKSYVSKDDAAIQAMANSINGSLNALDAAGGIFGTLILDIIAIVFIWMAFMAAKGMNKIIGAVLDPFENFGKEIGKLGTSLPKYAPLPIPGGNIAGATKIAGMGQSALEYRSQQKLEEDPLYKYLKSKTNQTTSAASIATTKDRMANGSLQEAQSDIRKYKAEDNEEVIKAITANESAIVSKLRDMQGTREGTEAKTIYDKIKSGTADNTDKLAFQALMGGARWSDIETAYRAKNNEGLKNEINKRQATATKETTDNTTVQNTYNTTILTNNNKRMQTDIAGSRIDTNLDGSNIGSVNEEEKKKLKELISSLTEEQFTSRIKGVDESTAKAIALEIKKATGGEFKSKETKPAEPSTEPTEPKK